MRIGLVDVDGHNFPNFALMKIAAFHKGKGDSVEWAMPLFGHYDRVYKSKIFTFTPDEPTDWRCEVIRGGTGYDIRSRLADEIEASTLMDYSIYPQYPFSIQFFSRGCIRHCPFCLVHDKEGGIACDRLGFSLLGIEMDEHYYNAARERIKTHQATPRLF